jgi:hypothetical protein
MKYEELKEEIRSISEIAESVPERFRERCFDLLLQRLLDSGAVEARRGPAASAVDESQKKPSGNEIKKPTSDGKIPIQTQMKVFMQKTGITLPDIEQVLIFDEGSVHFIQEPKTQRISRGQIEWSLLLALKNGIETNNLSVDPEAVRSMCQEKGFYEISNFWKAFKTETNVSYFQGPMESQGQVQKLTAEGMKELAKLIKQLAPST